MTDLVAIYDPQLEVGAIVDTDTMRAIGPMGVGPNAQGELSQFIAAMPPTVFNMTSYDLVAAYMEYWQQNFAGLYEPTPEGDPTTTEQPGDTGGDAARLAEHTSIASAGEPPAAAPADTDMGADAGSADQVMGAQGDGTSPEPAAQAPTQEQVMQCFACEGIGSVPGRVEGERTTCNMCKGSGKVTMPVPA